MQPFCIKIYIYLEEDPMLWSVLSFPSVLVKFCILLEVVIN